MGLISALLVSGAEHVVLIGRELPRLLIPSGTYRARTQLRSPMLRAGEMCSLTDAPGRHLDASVTAGYPARVTAQLVPVRSG